MSWIAVPSARGGLSTSGVSSRLRLDRAQDVRPTLPKPSDDGGLPPEPPAGDFAARPITVVPTRAVSAAPALPVVFRSVAQPDAAPAGDFATKPISVIAAESSTAFAPIIAFRPIPQPDAPPAGDFALRPISVIAAELFTATVAPIVYRPAALPVPEPARNAALVVKALATVPPSPAVFLRAPQVAPGDFPAAPVHVVAGYAARVAGRPLQLRPLPDLGPALTGVPGTALSRSERGSVALSGATAAVASRSGDPFAVGAVAGADDGSVSVAGSVAAPGSASGSARGSRARAGTTANPKGVGR